MARVGGRTTGRGAGRAAVSPPPVAPVLEHERRPFWSVMIPTYNCADLLTATLEGVLAQAPGPDEMEIEVVDDCSTRDHPEDVTRRVGDGRVGFFRHRANVGVSANFTACVRRSRGQWVHLLHGDDVVFPGFYDTVQASIDADPGLDAVIVGCDEIDTDDAVVGRVVPLRSQGRGVFDDDFVDWLFTWNPIRTPAIVVRRSVYEQVGAFHPDLRHWADWDMWKRVALGHRIFYDPAVVAGYRVHGRSDTSALRTGGADLRELLRAVRIGRDYLSPQRGRACDSGAYLMARKEAWDRLVHSPDDGTVARGAGGTHS